MRGLDRIVKFFKKIGLFTEFGEHLGELDSPIIFEGLESLVNLEGWKNLYRLPKRTFGIDGAHRNTSWLKKMLLVLFTLVAYVIGVTTVIVVIMFVIGAVKVEFIIWLRERLKYKWMVKEVNKVMDKRKQDQRDIVAEKSKGA